jgi:predicted acyl esterase
VLTEPLRISGAAVANLIASTSGTDSNWVVKLIDVYPDEVPSKPAMAQPKDYVKATQRVYRAGETASFIELPLVPAATARAGAPAAPGAPR